MSKKNALNTRLGKAAIFVLVCFFMSGLSGLLYEILWTRMIVKIIGCAPFAVSIVLTVFMGGLGLGSYLAGRIIDRIKEPVKLVKIYGLLELIIGAYGFLLPLLLVAFKPVYAILYNRLFDHFMIYNLLTFVGCAILLAIPVICMGATLPILCRFYVRQLSHLGSRAGRLYGLNTIGAALGALLGGFWLIALLGVWGTLAVAIAINTIIGLLCMLVKVPTTQEDTTGLEQQQMPEVTLVTSGVLQNRATVNAAVLIFAISGFCAMAYEVIWVKLLAVIVGPTTYSFTIVLVTFISGLAIGSIIFGKLADKTKKPLNLLIITQIAAALFALSLSQILGNSQLFFSKLIFQFKDNFAMLSMVKGMVLAAFMIAPTICLGATFPLVGKIYTQSVKKVGRSIGFAYAINTIGAVLGSFCAGFVLIPLLGKENSISLVVGTQLFTAVIIAMIILSKNNEAFVKRLAFVTPAFVGLFLCLYFPVWDHLLLSEGKYHRFDRINLRGYGWGQTLLNGPEILKKNEFRELVYYGDGIGGFITVLKYPDPFGNSKYSMINTGKGDASSYWDMKTQTLAGNLPLLFHPNAKTVMVLGMASGVTAGEVLNYPVERLDVLEISQEVVKASDIFLPWNNNVVRNPRTDLIIQDARAHLQSTERKYDVIISEPSNPWMAGMAALFTYDFFTLAKEKLNEDGIYIQWVHSYQMDWDVFSLVGRTFKEAFPNSLLVLDDPSGIGSDFMFVGFKGKDKFKLENAERNAKYMAKSGNITFLNPKLLYRLIVSEDLKELFGHGFINTDSSPRLEFMAPKMMHREEPLEILGNVKSKKYLSPRTEEIVRQLKTDIDAQIDFAAYALSVYKPFESMVDLSKATPQQKERFFKMMENYFASNQIDYSIFTAADNELAARCYGIQMGAIKNNINGMNDKDKVYAYTYLARLYYALGMFNESMDCQVNLLKLRPDDAEAYANIGTILLLQGKIDESIEQFSKAVRIRPDLAAAYSNMAYALKHQKRFEEAAGAYRRAAHLMPDNPKLHNDLGIVLVEIGKFDEAAKQFEHALRIEPDYADAATNLTNALVQIAKTKK